MKTRSPWKCQSENAVPEKRLVVIPFERIILTFSPSSRPTSENGEAKTYVDIAPPAKYDQAQTPVQSMATSLLDLIRNKADKALIRAAELLSSTTYITPQSRSQTSMRCCRLILEPPKPASYHTISCLESSGDR